MHMDSVAPDTCLPFTSTSLRLHPLEKGVNVIVHISSLGPPGFATAGWASNSTTELQRMAANVAVQLSAHSPRVHEKLWGA
jgi:NADH:ubiquinone oxidoreductase subunit H